MLKIFKNKKIFFLVILFFLLIYSFSFAQNISILSDKNKYNVGDNFLVEVKIDSFGKAINSLGGVITIPEGLFDISDIQIGSSFISLWTQRPKLENNEIFFSGGLPGGYSGSDGTIFTFILKTKKEGSVEIRLRNFEAFLNDGRATPISPIKMIFLPIIIENNINVLNEVYLVKKDIVPPEDFELSISRDISIDDNKYFVSFFAIDKGSGIARYEVEEDPWIVSLFGYKKVWKEAENPQILYYQKWFNTIKVRAFDSMGNVTEEKIIKLIDFENKIYLVVLLFVILLFFTIKKNRK